MMNDEYLSRQKIGKILRKMRMSDNTLLLIKQGSPLAKTDVILRLRNVIEELGYSGIGLLVVDEFTDINAMSELDMNKLGWYRLGKVKQLITGTIEEIDEEKENSEGDS